MKKIIMTACCGLLIVGATNVLAVPMKIGEVTPIQTIICDFKNPSESCKGTLSPGVKLQFKNVTKGQNGLYSGVVLSGPAYTDLMEYVREHELALQGACPGENNVFSLSSTSASIVNNTKKTFSYEAVTPNPIPNNPNGQCASVFGSYGINCATATCSDA